MTFQFRPTGLKPRVRYRIDTASDSTSPASIRSVGGSVSLPDSTIRADFQGGLGQFDADSRTLYAKPVGESGAPIQLTAWGSTAWGSSAQSSAALAASLAGDPALTSTYVAVARQPVNVKDPAYGAQGDGVTDDTASIDAAFAVRGAIYLPAGTYVYDGTGYTGNHPIVKGDGRALTQINLGAGKSLLTRSGAYTQLHVEGIRFYGGFGAIRHTYAGINVQSGHVVRDCDFSEYTGAAISTLSVDMPYWKITGNVFYGANFTTTIGVAIGGNTDLCTIENNVFLKNRVHVKLTHGGNNAKVVRNDFIRFGATGGVPRVDVWVVPSTTGNIGAGFEVGANKFGNENLGTGDLLVCYADEDAATGTDRADRFPDLDTESTGSIGGHQIVDNLYNGSGDAPRPLIFSTTQLVSNGIVRGIIGATAPTYICQYLVAPASSRILDSNIYGPFTTNGAGVEVPSIAATNGAHGTYRLIDPWGMFTGSGLEPASHPGAGDVTGYSSLLAAAMSTYSTVNATLTPIADAAGGTDATETTFAAASAIYHAITAPTVGVPAWVEMDIKQGASPAAHVLVTVYKNGGAVHLKRVITATSAWRRYRFPWTPRDASGTINISFAPRIAGDAGDIRIGRVRIYHGDEPVNVDGYVPALRAPSGATVNGSLIRTAVDVPATLEEFPSRAATWLYPEAVSKTTGSLSPGPAWLSSRILKAGVVLDRIACEITTTGSAGALVRMGIYADDGTGKPGTRVLDAGTLAGDGTTGVKEITISYTIPTTGRYWFALATEVAAVTFRKINVLGELGGNSAEAFSNNLFGHAGASNSFAAGGLPTTFSSYSPNGSIGQVVVRVA